jgi:hypothetical protein
MKTITGEKNDIQSYFTVEVVIGRMTPDSDARLREIMTVVIRRLHEAVKEISPAGG